MRLPLLFSMQGSCDRRFQYEQGFSRAVGVALTSLSCFGSADEGHVGSRRTPHLRERERRRSDASRYRDRACGAELCVLVQLARRSHRLIGPTRWEIDEHMLAACPIPDIGWHLHAEHGDG
jgi:hypothetical protein